MTASNLCSVPGCDKPPYRSGMCNAHRIRMRRHGSPTAGRRSPGINNCGAKECPIAKKIWAAIHYLRNSDVYKKRANQWSINNPDSYNKRKQTYFAREDIILKAREKAKKWRQDNPERKREMDKKFVQENRALVTSYKAKRRAAQKCATPSWLTKEQIEAIRDIYKEARRLTIETGIQYEVDHIVPLDGRIVSGLHVPWNLRAIPKDENNRRPRIYMDN